MRRGNGGGLSAQQQDVAGLLGQIGAGAHGDAGVGLGQGGGVVDAVADHRHAQAALLKSANAGQLSCGVEAGFHFGDSGLRGDGRGSGSRVAGEHEHAQAGAAERGDGFGCIGAQSVAGIEEAGGLVVESHPQARYAGFGWCYGGWQRDRRTRQRELHCQAGNCGLRHWR